ncbi:hypothetical protein PVAND_004126 [Polypedilum vanderplanki]|uniref:DUF243 domain-containing protein n=1 Tax=Polypedilum vanderplanki TaxID=319348 RepID=A0A9J6BX90_POLVA|nr:hypothetical protein PVAND_004126 [Polypedilum vanderplanki]
MRAFVLFAVLAVAVARPEAPGGYNYNRPSAGGYSGASQGGYVNGGYQSGGVSGGAQSFGGGFNGASSSGAGFSSGGGFGGSSVAGFGGQQQTIVQKHIYVHVPPPEEEAAVAHQQQQLAAPRKHYKIIFIKAPSAPSITQQIAAAQAQNEEKTLIYVLVKKPEDLAAGPGPAPVPQLPVSKPEVYFIKYKTQKDSSSAGASAGSFGGASSGFGGSDFSSSGGSSSGGSGFGASTSGGSFGSGSGGVTDFHVSNPASSYGAPHKK